MSKELLTAWDTLYQSKVGSRYPINGGKDGALLKGLRAIYSDADITRFMEAFFAMNDPFFAQTGYSLGCFRSCLPKVIAWVNRKGSVAIDWEKAPEPIEHWAKRLGYCRHQPRCEEAGGAECVAMWKMEKREQSA